MRKTNCANTEGIFRIIQSIPSPKAEPFKRRLARVGYERVQEIEDPGLATQRTKAIYRAKGYSDAWIEKRMRGIAIRARDALFGSPDEIQPFRLFCHECWAETIALVEAVREKQQERNQRSK